MRENARQGFFNGSNAPFGYRAAETEALGNRGRRKRKLAVDEAEAALVRRIFDLYLDGFDGRRSGNPLAQGLPHDRKVGIHRLGSYDGPNACRIQARERRRLRIEAPPAKYASVRFLVAGGTGDSSVPVVLEYAGSHAERRWLELAVDGLGASAVPPSSSRTRGPMQSEIRGDAP